MPPWMYSTNRRGCDSLGEVDRLDTILVHGGPVAFLASLGRYDANLVIIIRKGSATLSFMLSFDAALRLDGSCRCIALLENASRCSGDQMWICVPADVVRAHASLLH